MKQPYRTGPAIPDAHPLAAVGRVLLLIGPPATFVVVAVTIWRVCTWRQASMDAHIALEAAYVVIGLVLSGAVVTTEEGGVAKCKWLFIAATWPVGATIGCLIVGGLGVQEMGLKLWRRTRKLRDWIVNGDPPPPPPQDPETADETLNPLR